MADDLELARRLDAESRAAVTALAHRLGVPEALAELAPYDAAVAKAEAAGDAVRAAAAAQIALDAVTRKERR